MTPSMVGYGQSVKQEVQTKNAREEVNVYCSPIASWELQQNWET